MTCSCSDFLPCLSPAPAPLIRHSHGRAAWNTEPEAQRPERSEPCSCPVFAEWLFPLLSLKKEALPKFSPYCIGRKHPGLQPVALWSSALPPGARGQAGPATLGSRGGALRVKGQPQKPQDCLVSLLWTHQLRALRFPSVPLWLFYKMHFLQKHRKTGTALPPWPAAFNLQLSCWAPSLEAIPIPSQIHSISSHSFLNKSHILKSKSFNNSSWNNGFAWWIRAPHFYLSCACITCNAYPILSLLNIILRFFNT